MKQVYLKQRKVKTLPRMVAHGPTEGRASPKGYSWVLIPYTESELVNRRRSNYACCHIQLVNNKNLITREEYGL